MSESDTTTDDDSDDGVDWEAVTDRGVDGAEQALTGAGNAVVAAGTIATEPFRRVDWDGVSDRLAGATAAVVGAPFRVIPKRAVIYRKLFGASLKNYHKATGGDALGLIAEPGQTLDVKPVKYRAPKDCEPGERPGWVEYGGDKVWNAASDGRVVDYIGKTPVVALERDGHVEAGWLKPRIGQAVELDNYDGLYQYPEFDASVVADLSVEASDNGGPSALADGGGGIVDIDITDVGQYGGAEILDLDSGDGYDGMRVDFRKASEWAFETTSTEAMQAQEERGRLMGQLNGDDGPGAVKVLLIAAAIILGTLFIIEVLPILLSGEGGGGGGINPLMINALGALLPL